MKIVISIPDELFSTAGAEAKRLGMSRNALYCAAVTELFARNAESE